MNNWTIYTCIDRKLPSVCGAGYVYIVECGGQVKIGRTKNPLLRLRALSQNLYKTTGCTTGRVALSDEHTAANASELELHQMFTDYRVPKTEFFNLSFDEVMKIQPSYGCESTRHIGPVPHEDSSDEVYSGNEAPDAPAQQKVEELESEIKSLREQLRFAKKIAEALGFDWTKFYEEEQK